MRASARAKPNILFIAVDDLRPELACYGNPIIKSPNIDRIARAGVVFNRAYCQQAVCSPSRSSLLTGTRPDTTKVWDLKTHFRKALPDVVTLPQFFKNNGYFVQGMGKIYHGGYNDPPSWSVPWTAPKVAAYASAENLALVRKKRQRAIADGRNEDGIQRLGKARPMRAQMWRTIPSTMAHWQTWLLLPCATSNRSSSPSSWPWASSARTCHLSRRRSIGTSTTRPRFR